MSKLLSYIRRYPFIKKVIKYCVVGGLAAIINFSLYYSLTKVVGLWYVHSAILSFLASAVFNFVSNKFWTFRNKDAGLRAVSQFLKFSFVMVTGLIINTSLIYAFTEWGEIDWRFSWVLATGIVTFYNFTLNHFWTFKHKEEVIGEGEPDLSVPTN